MTDQLFASAAAMNERRFQTVLQKGLTREGWSWVFVRRMRTPDGRWLTGTSDAGWPDLCCLRGGHVLIIEVKSSKGKPTPGQLKWLRRWYDTGAICWVLNPTDSWQWIANGLAHPETAERRYGW
jgi:hypothetical protein